MGAPSHTPLKCTVCHICVREGEIERRRGAVTLSFWTAVGPHVLTLCGRCAAPIREVLHGFGLTTDWVEEVL